MPIKCNINKHHNKQMQIDFNNGDLFEINLIYQLPDKTSNNVMLALENLYIDKCNTINEGYNKVKNNIIKTKEGGETHMTKIEFLALLKTLDKLMDRAPEDAHAVIKELIEDADKQKG